MSVSLIHNESHARLLLDSYQRLLGKPLLAVDPERSLAQQLDVARFVLLSHNTDSDPLFNYGNQQALALFELTEDQLVQLPSRLSAEPVNQQQREALLEQVRSKGYIIDYSGVRISRTGKRFLIQQAVVWNLLDEHGQYHGQAACFSDWTMVD